MVDLPRHFFRVRENGAAVFRVATGARDRRLELEPIANVNVRNGEVKPQGGQALAPEDEAAIDAWLERRRAELHHRERDEVRRTVDRINLTAHWAQTRGSADEIEAVANDLLLAMHDLRTVLLRKRAERIARDQSERRG